MASSLGNMPITSVRRLISPFDRIGRADLGPMRFGEVHEGENIDLGLIEQGGEFRQLIGDMAPLFPGGRGVLGECGRDKGRDDAATVLAGMGESVAGMWLTSRTLVEGAWLKTLR